MSRSVAGGARIPRVVVGGAPVSSEPQDTALFALRLLAFLRTCAPLTQAMTLLVVTRFEVQVPVVPVVTLIAAELCIAALTGLRVSKAPRISSRELFWQAMLDVLLFALMLYFTGGATNPFAPLFVLPTAITAVALPARQVWIIAFTTMAAYVLLRYVHVPLLHPAGHTQVYDLHEDGMVINYLFTAVLLTYFCLRMIATLREREHMLAAARDTQMRNESVAAIGALAAGHAHQLSSPLATMAVVVTELQRQYGADARLRHDLALLDQQVDACKRIVSNLAHAAGRPRAEAAHGAPLCEFLDSIVDRARALNPGATIITTFGPATPAPTIVAEDTLRLAITNLIDNAARASPQHVEVHIDWSGGELLVSVRDRGPGFPAELLQRLGRQLDTSKGPEQGMGLGLLLSAVTLQRLGGRLELSNSPQGGARADLRLPLDTIVIETTSPVEEGPHGRPLQ